MRARRVLALSLLLEPVSALRNHVSPAQDHDENRDPNLPADLLAAGEMWGQFPPEPPEEETALTDEEAAIKDDVEAKKMKFKTQLNDSATYFGVWIAGIWGDCVEGCPQQPHPIKHRTIDCHDQFTANRLPNSYCNKRDAPNNWRYCDCAVESCAVVKEAWRCPQPFGGTAIGMIRESFRYRTPYQMGCFEMEKPPWADNATTADDDQFGRLYTYVTGYEDACMNWTNSAPCMTGVGFYQYANWTKRATGGLVSMWECYGFCLSKGFDIAGVEYGQTCRCGLTAVNRLFLRDPGLYDGSHFKRQGLTFQPNYLTPTNQMPYKHYGWKPDKPLECPLQIARYDGIYIDEAVPRGYWRINADDVTYMNSMKLGEPFLTPQGEADLADVADPLVPEDKPLGWGPWDHRDCEKDRCDFNPKWPYRTLGIHLGSKEKFWEYVEVWYNFGNVTQSMKETFRLAAEHFTRYTCIVWREVDHIKMLTAPTRPVVQVGVWVENAVCSVKKFAPGDPLYLKFDMGMCTQTYQYGEVLNQMMRVLGVRAEHNRPDATKTFRGHGPYLLVRWQHYHDWGQSDHTTAGLDITLWKHSSVWDYTGSSKVGYAPYDFDSITHIGSSLGNRVNGAWAFNKRTGRTFITRPIEMMSRVGQRIGLSKGDIMQLNDVYSCKTRNQEPPLKFTDPNASLKYGALFGSGIGWLLGGIYSGLDVLQKMFLGGLSGASVGHVLGWRMWEHNVDYFDWWKTLVPTLQDKD